jgi:hypothetical protein
MRPVIVEVKNDILGDCEFWRGPENLIEEIRNIPARMLARSVVAGGKPAQIGMWRVRIEEGHHDNQD